MEYVYKARELADYVPVITGGVIRVRVLGRLYKDRPETGTYVVVRVTSPSRGAYLHGEVLTISADHLFPRRERFRPQPVVSELPVVTRSGMRLWVRTVNGVDQILSELSRRELLEGCPLLPSARTVAQKVTIAHHRAYWASQDGPDRFVIEHHNARVSVYTR